MTIEHSISTLAILAVLKQCTSKENPLTASKLAAKAQLMGMQMEEKTVFRKLTSLCELFRELENSQEPEKKGLYHVLLATCAGRVQREEREPKRRRKAEPRNGHQQYVFYFEPIFQKSEVKMINGSIISNQYLSAEEKRYLLFSEYCLYGDEELESFEGLAEITEGNWEQLSKPGNSQKKDSNRKLLEIIATLYNAIEEERIVELTYGRYGRSTNGRVALLPVHGEKGSYILHPYAMLWCRGQYYLVATKHGSSNPIHLRVDRILKAQLWFDPERGEIGKRASIPETLKRFYSRRGKRVFLSEKYVQTYPLMSIHGEERIIRCKLYCHSKALSVVVDNFGKEQAIRVLESEGESEDERFLIELEAQYESILLFCLQQNRVVTAIEPKELVEDITDGLSRHLQRYLNR